MSIFGILLLRCLSRIKPAEAVHFPVRGPKPFQNAVVGPNRRPIAIWPDAQIPGSIQVPSYEQVTESYGQTLADPYTVKCAPGDTSNSFANITLPMLVPYELGPQVSDTTNAAVLVIPGGGTTYISWEKEGTDVAVWLNSLGISAYVLKYRVPGFEFAMQDVQRAVSVLRHYAPRKGINPKRIGTIGFGPGGALSMRLVTRYSRAYSPVDDADNTDYMPDFQMLIYPEMRAVRRDGTQVVPPPTFVAVARDDPCVNMASLQSVTDSLAIFGGEVDRQEYADGRHGYGTCARYTGSGASSSVCEWPARAKEFLWKILRPVSDGGVPTHGGVPYAPLPESFSHTLWDTLAALPEGRQPNQKVASPPAFPTLGFDLPFGMPPPPGARHYLPAPGGPLDQGRNPMAAYWDQWNTRSSAAWSNMKNSWDNMMGTLSLVDEIGRKDTGSPPEAASTLATMSRNFENADPLLIAARMSRKSVRNETGAVGSPGRPPSRNDADVPAGAMRVPQPPQLSPPSPPMPAAARPAAPPQVLAGALPVQPAVLPYRAYPAAPFAAPFGALPPAMPAWPQWAWR